MIKIPEANQLATESADDGQPQDAKGQIHTRILHAQMCLIHCINQADAPG